MKILKCLKCGNVELELAHGTCTPICCGVPMVELKANTQEGVATEKHVPVIEKQGNEILVKVGEVAHPMIEAHYIGAIIVETNFNTLIKNLKAGDAPEARFALAEGEEVVAAYSYCNLHGVWKLEK